MATNNVRTLGGVYNNKVSPSTPSKGVWTLEELYKRKKAVTDPPPDPDPDPTPISIADPTMPFWLKAGLPKAVFNTTNIGQSLALAIALDKTKI